MRIFLFSNAFLALSSLSDVCAQSLTYAAPLNITAKAPTYDSISFDVSTHEATPEDLTFSNDGLKMFIIGTGGDEINQYTLTNPYDISTGVSHVGLYDISGQEATPTGMAFSSDGTKLFVIGTDSKNIHQYTLSNPFDVTSGVSHDGSPFSLTTVGGLSSQPKDLVFRPDGLRLWVIDGINDLVYQLELNTAFDITGGVTFNGGSLSVNAVETDPEDLAFDACGDKLFVLGRKIHQYSLSTSYTTTSGVNNDGSPVTVNTLDLNANGIAFNPLQNRIFVVGGVTKRVYQFSVFNTVAYQETTSNDGTVSGCLAIEAESTSFVNAGGTLTTPTHFAIDNLPAGLTASLDVFPNGTFGALKLSGQGSPHKKAQNVSDLTFTFNDAAFDGQVASAVTNAVSANSGLAIEFDGEPILVSSNDSSTVSEGTTAAIDVDATIGSTGTVDHGITYNIGGGTDAGSFGIDASTGELTFNSIPDFEAPGDADEDNAYLVAVSMTDGEETVSQAITVIVSDANDNAPTFSSDSTMTVPENVWAIDTLRASDPDANSVLTYSITGGDDSSLLMLDETTGALTFVEQPDFENPDDANSDNVYNVTVQVSDGTLTDARQYAVTVSNIENEMIPEILSDSSAEFTENEQGNVLVVEAEDGDDGSVLTYSLSGGDDVSSFEIESASGELTFTTSPDFESPKDANSDNIYFVEVSVSDGSNTIQQIISIEVLNESEEPVANDQTFSIDENSSVGTLVGTVLAKDPEEESLQFTISDGNEDGVFALDSASGILTVKDSTFLDFEENDFFELFVEIEDPSGLSAEAFVTILVNDLDESDPETVLAVDDPKSTVEIFPNPITSVFSVNTTQDIKQVKLFTITGQLVRQFAPAELYTIQSVPKGLYLIEVIGNGETTTTKVVIK